MSWGIIAFLGNHHQPPPKHHNQRAVSAANTTCDFSVLDRIAIPQGVRQGGISVGQFLRENTGIPAGCMETHPQGYST